MVACSSGEEGGRTVMGWMTETAFSYKVVMEVFADKVKKSQGEEEPSHASFCGSVVQGEETRNTKPSGVRVLGYCRDREVASVAEAE